MKRVSELDHEPEVGKYYLVPCLILSHRIIPILGPEHEDTEYIGFKQQHFHFDMRFLPENQIKDRVGHFYLQQNKPTCTPEEFMMNVVTIQLNGKPIVEKRMKCRRRMPIFKIDTGVSEAKWIKPLEDAYADTKLNCARCPHRGGPLSADNADEHGNVVCPLHGLQWNLKTGKLVSRLEAVNA